MSYMIHLTKADNWNKRKAHPISLDEIEKLVREDKELEIRNGMTMKNPQTGTEISIPGIYIVWKSIDYDVWYRYSGFDISCSYDEDGRLDKLKDIALTLKAKIFGDEGEEF